MRKIHNPNPWTVNIVGTRFQAFHLALAQDEFTVVPTNIPFICRFPAPNDTLGVNTYRGNSFLRGRFEVTPHSSTPFVRERGDEMVKVRWVTEGGAEIRGLDEHNEFWCVNLRDPSEGIYLQENYPLEPGESVTIPNRDMERNIFVLEGEVSVEGTTLAGFRHVRLTKDRAYQITNESNAPAFILYFYQVTPSEFIAAGEPTLPEESYRKIPILQDSFWSTEDEPV